MDRLWTPWRMEYVTSDGPEQECLFCWMVEGTGEDDLYPLNLYLQAMKDIQEQFGREFMQRIGSYIFEKAVFPPGIESLVQGMGGTVVGGFQHQRGDQ